MVLQGQKNTGIQRNTKGQTRKYKNIRRQEKQIALQMGERQPEGPDRKRNTE
jgi:hypothetical protein